MPPENIYSFILYVKEYFWIDKSRIFIDNGIPNIRVFNLVFDKYTAKLKVKVTEKPTC